jgi:hypothetical protein
MTPEEILFAALASEGGSLHMAGLRIDYDKEIYRLALFQGASYEEVLVNMLVIGGQLHLIDEEGGHYHSWIDHALLHQRNATLPDWCVEQYEEGTDDADTAFATLQHLFYEEQIFC